MNQGDDLTLTSRLSMFFLATLALVLIGFSCALYFLARGHLLQQSEERLEAAMNTLVAAVEIGPDGVEWEPADRRLNIGSQALVDQVVWLVSDDQGQIVDRSKNLGKEEFLSETSPTLHSGQQFSNREDWQNQHWQYTRRWIGPASVKEVMTPPGPSPPEDGGRKYRALAITIGVSLEPIGATLHQLMEVLIGLSLGIWLVALLVGRLVCRRALLPVTRMAVAAGEMNVADIERRLPTPETGDELEHLSRTFNNLLDRLQESFVRQKRFTGDVSHQLRNPLTAILGQVEVALRRPRPAEEYQRVLTTVQQKAERLQRIVESLLFLARRDNEARIPELERINLNDWLPDYLQSWSEHSRASDLHLQCVTAGPSYVEVHPILLGESVNILIDNACKFSQQGTPITIRLHHEQREACIQVQDNGCGISAADLPHIFTPFFRSANFREGRFQGTGLGLSIAKRLAEAFGGVLTVTSHVGKGSCFTLRLMSSNAPSC
jgi:heavy metal sensor kinase